MKNKIVCSENTVLGIIVSLTILHWIILAFHLPVLTGLQGWFWEFFPKPWGSIPLVGLLLSVSFLSVYVVLRAQRRYAAKLVLLISLGAGLQFGFALLEGRGMEAVRNRMVDTGHAEFARVAVRQESIFHTLTHYEQLLDSGELGEFAHSKPPGTLFCYLLTHKLAQLVASQDDYEERVGRLVVVAGFLWPLLTYLVLIPLYHFAALIWEKETAILACVLYLFVPSVNLMTLHTDQVFFPLMFMTPLLVAGIACRRNRLAIALCAGVMIYLAIWFTFALMFVLPFVAGLCYVWYRPQGATWYNGPAIRVLLGVGLGILACDVLFRVVLDYDIVERFGNAMKYHMAWKGWDPALKYTVYYAGLNLLEFVLWVGIPISILACVSFHGSVAQYLAQRRLSLASLQPLVFWGTLLLIAFFGRTKGEVARLWLFMVPYMCMLAAYAISKSGKERQPLLIGIVVFLQWGTVYLTKVNQDFFP